MHFLAYRTGKIEGLAVSVDGRAFHGLSHDDARFPGWLEDILQPAGLGLEGAASTLRSGAAIDPDKLEPLPPLRRPGKIICLGLNYHDHAVETGFEAPTYPTLFARFPSSLIGAGTPIVRPKVSTALDFEGELVAVIGRRGRHILPEAALAHVAGYSIFNDASIRDYQLRTPQWTIGKNFDGTGAFGPYFVTADALPPGAAGLHLETRLNGVIVQEASTDQMIFNVAQTIALLSEAMTLDPGDMIVMGTPSGVGVSRKPRLFMKPGDVCEVEIDGLGVLRNPIIAEAH